MQYVAWIRTHKELLQEIRQHKTSFMYSSYYAYLFARIITQALAVKTGHLFKYPTKISLPYFFNSFFGSQK